MCYICYIFIKQDACHRRKHESRIRTSTALIPRQINMRELKHNSQHFVWFSYALATRQQLIFLVD